MAFVRIKKRTNARGEEILYGYVVENRWMKRQKSGPRQKVKAYLGRVVPLKTSQARGSVMLDPSLDYVNSVRKLVGHELSRHGLEAKDAHMFEGEGLNINLRKPLIQYNTSAGCIKLNEGILSTESLKSLYRFRKEGEGDGYRFAKLLVESGLTVGEELFVDLFKRIP